MHVNRPLATALILGVMACSWLLEPAVDGRGMDEPLRQAGTTADALCVYGGTNGALWLVQMEGVAQELKLSAEQREQFVGWVDELNAERRKLFRGLIGAKGPEHEQRAEEKRRRAAAVTETFHRQVIERLDPQQRTRLDELYVRFLGPRALFEPRLVAQLGLSDSQQQALRQVVPTDTSAPPLAKLLEVLTDAQRRQLKTLQGAPFTFPAPRFIQLQPGQPGQ